MIFTIFKWVILGYIISVFANVLLAIFLSLYFSTNKETYQSEIEEVNSAKEPNRFVIAIPLYNIYLFFVTLIFALSLILKKKGIIKKDALDKAKINEAHNKIIKETIIDQIGMEEYSKIFSKVYDVYWLLVNGKVKNDKAVESKLLKLCNGDENKVVEYLMLSWALYWKLHEYHSSHVV